MPHAHSRYATSLLGLLQAYVRVPGLASVIAEYVGYLPIDVLYSLLSTSTPLHEKLTPFLNLIQTDAVGRTYMNFTQRTVVNLPNELGAFSTKPFSVSLWMRTDKRLANSEVFSNRASGSNGNFFCIRYARGFVGCEIDDHGPNYAGVGCSDDICDNRWHHVLCRRQEKVIEIWVDGVRKGAGNSANTTNVRGEDPLMLGGSPCADDWNLWFIGMIGEVHVFPRWLDDDEVVQMRCAYARFLPPGIGFSVFSTEAPSQIPLPECKQLVSTDETGRTYMTFSQKSVVSLPNQLGQFATKPFTVSLWMRTNKRLPNSEVFSNRSTVSHGNFFCIRYANGKVLSEVDDDGTNYCAVRCEDDLCDDSWHHVVVRRRDTALELWVDAARKATNFSRSTVDVKGLGALMVGGSPCAEEASLWFLGSIGEVIVFSRWLEFDEIVQLNAHFRR